MNGQGQDPSSDDADRAAPVRGQPSATLDTGLTNEPSVPDYELLRRIGRGAYGDVWLARSKTTEFNWVIGVVLLIFTLLLSYTGYLLPWDQLAYWAITVGSNIMS